MIGFTEKEKAAAGETLARHRRENERAAAAAFPKSTRPGVTEGQVANEVADWIERELGPSPVVVEKRR